jgi:DNA-binding transcriptional ArsR family regulator
MADDLHEVAGLLRALADPVRVAVVEALGEAPRPAGELARLAGVTAPTMSKHLRTLLQAGLVTDERGPQDARLRVFRLRGDSVVAVRAWLDQVQAGWDEQLAAYRRHVERRNEEEEHR